MRSDLQGAATLLVLGGVPSVLRLELGWMPVWTHDLVQGLGMLGLLVAGLAVRAATRGAGVSAQTGLAVLLLLLAPITFVAGLQGKSVGTIAAPLWAAGTLLVLWAAARVLDEVGDPDAPVWSTAYVAGLLVWTPVAVLLGRVVWATVVTGVDRVDVGVEGAAGFLTTVLMLTPFVLLLRLRSTSDATTHAEVAA